MENGQSNIINLTKEQTYHKKLMVSILKSLLNTPLVLKGGTALFLAYGLNRFSEDLDFDSSKKLNLLNKIKTSAPFDIKIENINVKKNTDTVTRYIVNYFVPKIEKKNKLKVEISYRTPVPKETVIIKDGIQFASIERLIDNKLSVAYDGEYTRAKGRDLFDLHFLAKYYSNHFDVKNCERFKKFVLANKTAETYLEDFKQDELLKFVDFDKLVEELNMLAEQINNKKSKARR